MFLSPRLITTSSCSWVHCTANVELTGIITQTISSISRLWRSSVRSVFQALTPSHEKQLRDAVSIRPTAFADDAEREAFGHESASVPDEASPRISLRLEYCNHCRAKRNPAVRRVAYGALHWWRSSNHGASNNEATLRDSFFGDSISCDSIQCPCEKPELFRFCRVK